MMRQEKSAVLFDKLQLVGLLMIDPLQAEADGTLTGAKRHALRNNRLPVAAVESYGPNLCLYSLEVMNALTISALR